MRRSAVSLLSLFAVLALVFAGCGAGAGAGANADPAEVLPAGAPFYVEAVVRPDGDQADHLHALLGKVMGTGNPGAELEALFDQAIQKDSHGATFAKDVKPWLGKRLGMAVAPRRGGDTGYVVAFALKDAGKAADFAAKQAQEDGAQKGSTGGVDYFVDPKDHSVEGVAGDYLIVANDLAGFRRAVKTEADGGGLASVKRFSSALGDLPDDRLGAFWLDPQRFVALIPAQNAISASVLKATYGALKPITGYLAAADDRATVETRLVTPKGGSGIAGLAAGSGDASKILKSLPADAWGAVGSAKAGTTFANAIKTFGGGIGAAVITGQFERATGLSLQNDVLSWVGDVAVYVRGTSMADLSGAVVITATDAGKAASALPRLIGAVQQQGGPAFTPIALKGAEQAFAAMVPGAPGPVVVARSGARVVVALGRATAAEALSPATTLGDSGLYDRAAQALDGFPPSLLIAAGPALRLIGANAAGDPRYAKAKPYLDTLDLLAAGGKRDGDTVVSRVAVKVK